MGIEQHKRNRKVVVENFFYGGSPLYEDQLGWDQYDRREARSNVSKEIFEFQILKVRLNLLIYYVDNDTFYKIFGELENIEIHKCLRDRSIKYVDCQELDTEWCEGEVLQVFENDADVWDGIIIDGKHLGEVLERSYVVTVN